MNKLDNRYKIAFLTCETSYDKCNHSGSLYYMRKALEQHCGQVTCFENILSWERRAMGRIMREAAKRHLKWQIAYKRLLFVSKKQAKIASQRLAGKRFDVIVAPDCVPEVAFLQTNIPILLPLDITFCLQRDLHGDYHHPDYSRLLPFSVRHGEIVEQTAFRKASRLLFSSPWAALSAIEDYGIDRRKVHAIFWGANLDHIPSREQALAKKQSGYCRLLFIAVNWERKGGDIAFETLLKLHKMGIEAELIVCGCVPPIGVTHPHMIVIPFLDKNDERQAREIEKLYAMADFLILPTRGDCVPNVFGEANAFGVPVITNNIGGVAYAVRDGENGFVLPYDARGTEYAEVIAKIYQDDQRYAQMVRSSRAAFDQRLNWDTWGMAVKNVLNETLVAKNEV